MGSTAQTPRIHLDSPALEIVQRRYAARRPDQPLLFHHDGKPIRDMREPLTKAFAAAGIPYGRRVGKVFHGTRRTAVTNLVESGVPRSVAKTISGHSSDEMFERYAIHESDAQRAAQRQAADYVAKQQKKPKVVPIATKKKKGAA